MKPRSTSTRPSPTTSLPPSKPAPAIPPCLGTAAAWPACCPKTHPPATATRASTSSRSGFRQNSEDFSHSLWASYKQWQSLGAHVREGEKCSPIIFYKQFDVEPNPEDAADDGSRRVARASRVFNVAQVDGFVIEALPDLPPLERHARADAFIAATGADIRHGGEQAFYKPSTDHIQMPTEHLFRREGRRSKDYYSILNHELTHWTSASNRLNRELGKHFGDDRYAAEELVAELGSAFLCAQLGISSVPRSDHAPYIAHWLKVLKADNRGAIFSGRRTCFRSGPVSPFSPAQGAGRCRCQPLSGRPSDCAPPMRSHGAECRFASSIPRMW